MILVVQCALEFAIALDEHHILHIAVGALAQGDNGFYARILQTGQPGGLHAALRGKDLNWLKCSKWD